MFSVVAQPASSTGRSSEHIAGPAALMDYVPVGSSDQHCPTVSQQNRNVSPINAFFANMRMAHDPDPVPSVRPIPSADRGHPSAGGAPDFPHECLARQMEKCFALDENYFAREDRIVTL